MVLLEAGRRKGNGQQGIRNLSSGLRTDKDDKQGVLSRMHTLLNREVDRVGSRKKTDIVCTLGPASSSPGVISQMIEAGMTIARLNMSHGIQEDHKRLAEIVREKARMLGMPVKILVDLQGPKIRLGKLPSEGVIVNSNERVTFSTDISSLLPIIRVDYEQMHEEVQIGHRILIDDGTVEAVVIGVEGRNIHARILNGGKLSSKKGFNLPDSIVKAPSLSDKDREDVEFAIKEGADLIALSFVREAADIHGLSNLLHLRSSALIVAKIETPEGVCNFDEILKLTHWVMVARGDLGCEIPLESVPIAQAYIARRCNEEKIPFIVATQMMESMIYNTRPFRAEVADIANAIYTDRADAVMLSGETASGKHPVRVVQQVASIVKSLIASNA